MNSVRQARGTTRCVAAAVSLLTVAFASGCAQTTPADLVVVNANVLTVDAQSSKAGAVAIRDGRFVHVAGVGDPMDAFIGPDTRVIDAAGRTVIPGLIDTHVHALMVATAEATTPFRNLTSMDDIQGWVREQAARVPPGTWIWTPRVFPTRVAERRFPSRSDLDTAAPNHPVVVDGAYALMLNSAALQAAGITADTPDPPGGAIVKDTTGRPSGLLRNVGGLLARFRPAVPGGVPVEGIEAVHRAYLAAGITSVVERGASAAALASYQALAQDDRLGVRVTLTIQLPPPASEEEVPTLLDALPVKPGQGDDRLKIGALKLLVDGGILAGTAYMRDPYGLQSASLYGVDDPAYRGFLTVPPAIIARVFKEGHVRGWQMSAHVTGDAGVDTVLDAIEAAQQVGPMPTDDRRHTLIHAYFPNPETARRAARLGVIVDTQPAWYYKDVDALVPALGEARLQRFIGLRTWLGAGVHTAINTDHMFGLDGTTSMNPFNPFLTMYVAVTRRSESGAVVGPEEAVTREEALRLMTRDAAYVSFDEATRGSIEVGKLGDLVVLSDDLLTVPDERIRDIRADITVVGGRVLYER